MPSDKAEAARQKAAEVMATLKKGEPGDADKLMGKEERNGAATVLPLSWMARKFSGSKKEKEEKVVR